MNVADEIYAFIKEESMHLYRSICNLLQSLYSVLFVTFISKEVGSSLKFIEFSNQNNR